MPRTRPLAIAKADPNKRRGSFMARHDLRRMEFSGRSFARLIRAAGGADALVRLRRLYGNCRSLTDGELAGQFMLGCLDHFELYGRRGRPLVLVAHPYQIDARSRDQLAALGSVGLEVMVGRKPSVGWHNFARIHVRIWVRGSLPEPTPAERFGTLMELFD
jgi:hypothetical protein